MEYVRSTLTAWVQGTKQTMHQFLVATLHQCSSLGVMGVLRGHRMSIELEEPYPQASLDGLQQLIQEYDDINDVALFNDLQRSIAINQDDPGVGIRLAREVKDCIQRIRYKDALGARIVALSHLMHIYHLDLQARHRAWAVGPLPEVTDQLLTRAIKELQGGDADVFWATLSPDHQRQLAAYLQVPEEQVRPKLEAYLHAASESLFVEMQ
jgi:hypothetical protein